MEIISFFKIYFAFYICIVYLCVCVCACACFLHIILCMWRSECLNVGSLLPYVNSGS